MPGLPGDPIAFIQATLYPNGDLPADPFPSLTRITVIDRVGPTAANQQDKAEEKRTETIRATVNLLVASMITIDNNYIRNDGSVQKNGNAGILANMPMNGHILTGMGNGTLSTDSCAYGQLTTEIAARSSAVSAVIASLAAYAPLASPALTGNPTAPTQTAGDSSTKLATTAFVQGALASVGSVIEVGTAGHTYAASGNVVVVLTAVGGGAGGGSDNFGGHGGGAGGAVVGLPIALSNGDSITVSPGTGGGGGSNAYGGNGAGTTITVTRSGVVTLALICGGGVAGTTGGGAGGTVTYQGFSGSGPLSTVAFPASFAGSPGFGGGSSTHEWCNGGASALALGGSGITSDLSHIGAPGTYGSGGGGGDSGTAGGDGYACLVIFNR